MINNLKVPNIRLFVFGTLREGERFDYYMEGSLPKGLHCTRGQLMLSENGSAYIDFERQQSKTIGELHLINYFCLKRINHLESTWGEFPKAYDLDLIPVWPCDLPEEEQLGENAIPAFVYKRRAVTPIPGGDWKRKLNVLDEIGRFCQENNTDEISDTAIIARIRQIMAW